MAGDNASGILRPAERVGFEPTVVHRATTVFETVPFNHSGTSPVRLSSGGYYILNYGESGHLSGMSSNMGTCGFPGKLEAPSQKGDGIHLSFARRWHSFGMDGFQYSSTEILQPPG